MYKPIMEHTSPKAVISLWWHCGRQEVHQEGSEPIMNTGGSRGIAEHVGPETHSYTGNHGVLWVQIHSKMLNQLSKCWISWILLGSLLPQSVTHYAVYCYICPTSNQEKQALTLFWNAQCDPHLFLIHSECNKYVWLKVYLRFWPQGLF